MLYTLLKKTFLMFPKRCFFCELMNIINLLINCISYLMSVDINSHKPVLLFGLMICMLKLVITPRKYFLWSITN